MLCLFQRLNNGNTLQGCNACSFVEFPDEVGGEHKWYVEVRGNECGAVPVPLGKHSEPICEENDDAKEKCGIGAVY